MNSSSFRCLAASCNRYVQASEEWREWEICNGGLPIVLRSLHQCNVVLDRDGYFGCSKCAAMTDSSCIVSRSKSQPNQNPSINHPLIIQQLSNSYPILPRSSQSKLSDWKQPVIFAVLESHGKSSQLGGIMWGGGNTISSVQKINTWWWIWSICDFISKYPSFLGVFFLGGRGVQHNFVGLKPSFLCVYWVHPFPQSLRRPVWFPPAFSWGRVVDTSGPVADRPWYPLVN